MKKKGIIIIIVLLLIIAFITIIWLIPKSKDKDDEYEIMTTSPKLGKYDFLVQIPIEDVSNDISDMKINAEDRIDLYDVSSVLKDESQNEPLVSVARFLYYLDEDFNRYAKYNKKVQWLMLAVSDGARDPLKKVISYPTEAFVIKKSNNKEETINKKLSEIILSGFGEYQPLSETRRAR